MRRKFSWKSAETFSSTSLCDVLMFRELPVGTSGSLKFICGEELLQLSRVNLFLQLSHRSCPCFSKHRHILWFFGSCEFFFFFFKLLFRSIIKEWIHAELSFQQTSLWETHPAVKWCTVSPAACIIDLDLISSEQSFVPFARLTSWVLGFSVLLLKDLGHRSETTPVVARAEQVFITALWWRWASGEDLQISFKRLNWNIQLAAEGLQSSVVTGQFNQNPFNAQMWRYVGCSFTFLFNVSRNKGLDMITKVSKELW